METRYPLPNGDTVIVTDTATVSRNLQRVLELFRGDSEPVFFAGAEPRPEAVVISFDQWVECEETVEEAAQKVS